MNNFPRSLLGAAIASILAAPAVVWAQSADATLRGNAPANSEITARNVATGVTRRTKAGNGLINLRVQPFTQQREIRFRAGAQHRHVAHTPDA